MCTCFSWWAIFLRINKNVHFSVVQCHLYAVAASALPRFLNSHCCYCSHILPILDPHHHHWMIIEK